MSLVPVFVPFYEKYIVGVRDGDAITGDNSLYGGIVRDTHQKGVALLMNDLLVGGFFFPAVAVYAGGAVYIGFVLRSVFLESGGYAHCPMVGTVLAHPFHTQHHFVIVAHAHGFYDVAFQVVAHGAVQPAEPVGLVGEDTRQRQDNEYGNVFQRQFHGGSLIFVQAKIRSYGVRCIVR